MGEPVEPEVYWRKASESAVTRGFFHAASPPASSVSVATQRSDFKSGALSKSTSTMEAMKEVVSTTVARESSMMARSRGSVRSSRAGSGG